MKAAAGSRRLRAKRGEITCRLKQTRRDAWFHRLEAGFSGESKLAGKLRQFVRKEFPARVINDQHLLVI
jgi:hypothetical protein